MTAMRLAFFDDRHSMVYGAQENLLLLAEGCAQRGHVATVVTTAEGLLAERARSRGLAVIVVPAPASLLEFGKASGVGGPVRAARLGLDAWRFGRRAMRRLDEAGVDVVLASGVRSMVLLASGRRRHRRGGRTRRVLYAQNSTPFPSYATVAAAVADRIALIDDGARSTFPRLVLRLVGRRLRPLPSGRKMEPLAAIASARSNAPRSRRPVVLCVAAIEERKRLHDIVSAVALAQADLGPVDLRVVGGANGPERERCAERLVHQALDAGVDLTLEGWRDDVHPYYLAADVFVLASQDEGLPGVLLEALGTGLPCVATDAGGAGDLVRRSGGGLVVTVGDVHGLASAISSLVSSPQLWAAASAAGAAHVQSRFGVDAFVDAFEAILHDLGRPGS